MSYEELVGLAENARPFHCLIDPDELQADVKRKMISLADRIFLLAASWRK